MEHDVPTASDELRIADNKSVPIRPEGKDCSASLLADGNGTMPTTPCQESKFAFTATDANGKAAKDLPAIWLDSKSVEQFVLQPNSNHVLDPNNSILKPYPEIAAVPTLSADSKYRLDLNNAVQGVTTRSTNFYDSIARRDAEITTRNIEPYPNPVNDTVADLLGLAKKFGISAPSTSPTFGQEIGQELSGARRPGDGMPLQRFPQKRGFTVGGSTNLITNDEYSFDIGANVSMRKIPDELKSVYGGSNRAVEGRLEFKLKF